MGVGVEEGVGAVCCHQSKDLLRSMLMPWGRQVVSTVIISLFMMSMFCDNCSSEYGED